MITFLSLVTSVKDYIEITHKLLESYPGEVGIKSYDEFGSLLTYFVILIKDFLSQFFTLNWLKNVWSLPILVPDITSAMISEVSVLSSQSGYFGASSQVLHNAFTFFETGDGSNAISYGQQNFYIYGIEKFMIGLINSLFLVLPTSAAHIITLRRFVMQGLEAGYYSGLGTIAGNILWFSSVIFGWRFFVIPWLSFDIFRYLLGFILLVKYMWDSTKERRMVLEDLSKWKIFLLNFLLALTEQTCVYPFISNISIGPEASILETFPTESFSQFIFIHGAYIFGLLVGCYSLLQFSCWFWEYPAFSIYMWVQTKSNVKLNTSYYYKILNFVFTYLTMLCAISSIPYFGLDYTITNPLGFVPQDRLIYQGSSLGSTSETEKVLTETSFLGVQPTNKNMRSRDGQIPRRERWRERLVKYQAFDASVYDQGVYDFLTIEDLNYGFDRFWLRRKMRNHRIYFKIGVTNGIFRSAKKKLNQPRTSSVKSEFFRILFEQYYHPSFHKPSVAIAANSSFYNPSITGASYANVGRRTPGEINQPNNTVLLSSLQQKRSLLEAPQKPIAQSSIVESGAFRQMTKFGQADQQGNSQIGKWTEGPYYGYEARKPISLPLEQTNTPILISTTQEFSALRKFVRYFNNRIKLSSLVNDDSLNGLSPSSFGLKSLYTKNNSIIQPIYSKRWKHLYSKILGPSSNKVGYNKQTTLSLRNISKNLLTTNIKKQFELLSKKEKQFNSFLSPTNGTLKSTEERETNGSQKKGFLSSFSKLIPGGISDSTVSKVNKASSFYMPEEQTYAGKTLLSKTDQSQNNISCTDEVCSKKAFTSKLNLMESSLKRTQAREKLSKKDRQLLRYKSLLLNSTPFPSLISIGGNKQSVIKSNTISSSEAYFDSTQVGQTRKNQSIVKGSLGQTSPLQGSTASAIEGQTILHPLKYYIQKEESFRRKLKFYGATVIRKFSVGNNAPYFRTLMKRSFYYYKPTARWKRTLFLAQVRFGFRKKSRIPRKLIYATKTNSIKTSSPSSSSPLGFALRLGSGDSNVRSGQQGVKLGGSISGPGDRGVRGPQASKEKSENSLYFDPNLSNTVSQNRSLLLTKPTHSYSVKSERAKRYRNQIYRDVLQHWYYTPFNRLLLKFDIDAFMNRQPKSHFLTKNEEQLLHLKRVLLSEHYDTLRWYTFMQNYRSMKNRIGGTKSFASKTYNQQFQGTFKKIRHLFAITPSQSNRQALFISPRSRETTDFTFRKKKLQDNTTKINNQDKPDVLKFDQLLYNESKNSIPTLLLPTQSGDPLKYKKNNRIIDLSNLNASLLSNYSNNSLNAYAHEELFNTKNNSLPYTEDVKQAKNTNKDLISNSTNLVGNYLIEAQPIRENYIKQLLQEKNYAELTQFLYKGQKIRGQNAITNQKSLLKQETQLNLNSFTPLAYTLDGNEIQSDFLLKEKEKQKLNELERNKIKSLLKSIKNFNKNKSVQSQLSDKKLNGLKEELLVTILKESKKRLNNKTFFKNYISYRTETLKKTKEKLIETRLDRLKNWLAPISLIKGSESINLPLNMGSSNPINETNTYSFYLPSNNINPESLTNKDFVATTGLYLSSAYLSGAYASVAGIQKEIQKEFTNLDSLKRGYKEKVVKDVSNVVKSNLNLSRLTTGEDLLQKEEKLKASLESIKKILQTKSYLSGDYLGSWGLGAPTPSKNFSHAKSNGPQIQKDKQKKLLNSSLVIRFNKILKQTKKTLLNTSFTIKNVLKNSVLKTITKPAYFLLKQRTKTLELWRKKQKAKRKLFGGVRFKHLPNLWKEKDTPEEPAKELAKEILLSLKRLNKSANKPVIKLEKDDLLDLTSEDESLEGSTQISPQGSLQARDLDLTSGSPAQRKKEFYANGVGIQKESQKTKENFLSLYANNTDWASNMFQTREMASSKQLKHRFKSVLKLKKFNKRKKNFYSFDLYYNKGMRNYPLPYAPGLRKRRLIQKETLNRLVKTQKAQLLKQSLKPFSLFKFNLIKSSQKKKRKAKMNNPVWRKRNSYKTKFRYYLNNSSEKIEKLAKSLARIKYTLELQKWLWQTVIPSKQLSIDKTLEISSNKNSSFIPALVGSPSGDAISQIKGQDIENSLASFSSPVDSSSIGSEKYLQIGNLDFKPLSIPFNSYNSQKLLKNDNKNLLLTEKNQQSFAGPGETLVNRLYENLFVRSFKTNFKPLSIEPVNPMPFYAGWDESLRKFVVTNRFLSRRDAGFSLRNINEFNTLKSLEKTSSIPALDTREGILNSTPSFSLDFTHAPFLGLNFLSSAYWKPDIQFQTYAFDQFFPTNASFYAPVGWRRFQFRHSILKTWLTDLGMPAPLAYKMQKNQDISSCNNELTNKNNCTNSNFSLQGDKEYRNLVGNARGKETALLVNDLPKFRINDLLKSYAGSKFLDSNSSWSEADNKEGLLKLSKAVSPEKQNGNLNSTALLDKEKINWQKFKHRRIKKRYNLMDPAQKYYHITYLPTGALLTEVLPSHYLSVFDSEYRVPDYRYLKRRLFSLEKNNNLNSSAGSDTLASKRNQASLLSNLNQNLMPINSIIEYNNNKTSLISNLNSSLYANEAVPSGRIQTRNLQDSSLSICYPGCAGMRTDFTFRKRIKPKRKYHRKRTIKAGKVVFPIRRKFLYDLPSSPYETASKLKESQEKNQTFPLYANKVGINKTSFETATYKRWRPSIEDKSKIDIKKEKRDKAKLKKRAKTNLARVRRNKRRLFKQVLKPLQRFQPRYGGFYWPGNSPGLELSQLSKITNFLAYDSTSASIGVKPGDPSTVFKGESIVGGKYKTETSNIDNKADSVTNKEKNKASINSQEEISKKSKVNRKINTQNNQEKKRNIPTLTSNLPRKYLIEKHNILVLKKKLEKAHKLNKTQERVKELKEIFNDAS